MKDLNGYIKIARPDHWIKNFFILPGTVFALLLTDVSLGQLSFWKLLAGFAATCLIASANYVINEWLDAPYDKYHPTKKYRPVVTGNMKLGYVLAEYALLIVLGLAVSIPLGGHFIRTELWLLVMGVLYNVKPVRTKDVPYLDVISESVNNMIRLLLGWFIVTDSALPPSSLLLGYWMGGAFLMAIKRFSEYHMIGSPETAGLYRRSFRYYKESTLMASAVFYALVSTFCIGVFLIKYRIEYLITIPFIFLLFAYYVHMSFAKDSPAQKPEKLYRDKILLSLCFVVILVFIITTVADIPALDIFISDELIRING